MPLTIDVIVGARPNFMKAAALFAVAADFPALLLRLVHTGQHYDFNMSDVFLQELRLPQPLAHLGVGSGSHAAQTAEVMKRYEGWVEAQPPEVCVVVGDVNSTIACALVAAKLGIRVAHVEAGLRSFDRTMPEEINRLLTDAISDLLFASEPSGAANLKREGRPAEAIHLVGNTMIDTLLRMKPKAAGLRAYEGFGLTAGEYAYLTLHRPANVDDPDMLAEIVAQTVWLAGQMPVLFPAHPRTRQRLEEMGLGKKLAGSKAFQLVEPVGYLESLSLTVNARLVVTDSGGLQEETTALGVPCLTLRENTERPITIEQGTNTLIGRDWALFRQAVGQIIAGEYPGKGGGIALWDGNAGRRIMDILARSEMPTR